MDIKSSINSKYREIKDSIPTDIGKLVYKITKIILMVTIFIVIPVLFTTLSTLMGAGTISSAAYYGVFYTVWVLFFIDLILMVFFAEYNKKE